MKQIRMLAQYYVDLMMKLGLVRFSLLLALALVVLAIVVQMAVTMVLHGQVESIDVIRSIFFGLLITPWAVYFLSVVVEQLEESRQRLSRLVQKLEEMRERELRDRMTRPAEKSTLPAEDPFRTGGALTGKVVTGRMPAGARLLHEARSLPLSVSR